MKFSRIAPVLLIFAPLQSVAAQLDAKISAPAEPTAKQNAANEAAKALGERIYRHDQAAWHGSDALFAQINAAEHPEVRGYLTEELPDDRIALVFYAEFDGANFEFARFEMHGSDVVSGGLHAEPAEYPLSVSLERQVKAREVTLLQGIREKLALCSSGAPNLVALSPDSADEVAVYILSSQIDLSQFPLGGHYLFKVDALNRVVGGRAFSSGCFDVPIINADVTNPPDHYAFAHVLDDQPNEMHYFVAQNVNIPLAITAGGVLWTISGHQHSDIVSETIKD